MCGICGIVHKDPEAPIDRGRLLAMRDAIKHRGPDDSGTHETDRVQLGSRRLAILDLSANGHMPMQTPDGRYTIAYNGECYNFAELRPALEAKGHRFRSNSDTEVLLYLYVEEGPEMLHWLNGMFTMAIWDERERSLFLARDRMGVKPLYYAQQGGKLFFASEQKALFAAGIRAEFDESMWEELLCFRYVAGERTPFTGVQRLLPGHQLTWKDGRVTTHRWWNLSDRARTLRSAVPNDPVEWFSSTFDSAVRYRQISDVPVGVLLSGGLDSGCVAASLGAQGAKDIASFTVRFKQQFYDEGPLAQIVAKKWGLDYHELFVDDDALAELITETSWLNDEPLAHANDPHLYAIAKYAKPRVTVLLAGEGADEVMGGYVRYQPLRFLGPLIAARSLVAGASALTPRGHGGTIAGRVHKLDHFLKFGRVDEFMLFNACDVLPPELDTVGFRPADTFDFRRGVLAEAKDLYPHEPMRQTMYLDQHSFLVSILDRNDRTTMGASIECRVPFLDYRIVEGLAAMPSKSLFRGYKAKGLLREAFAHRLPPEILTHKKWGFGVPWQEYFNRDKRFRDIIGAIPDSAPVRDGPFDRAKVRRLVDGYLKGDLTHHALIRQFFFVSVWHKACIVDSASSARSSRVA